MWKIASTVLDWLLPHPALSLPEPRVEEVGTRKVTVLFRYRDPLVRRTIWALKYRGNREAVMLCAEALYDVLMEEIAERATWHRFEMPFIVPIPLSKKRYRSRGFNQCELVVRALIRKDAHQYFQPGLDVLYKIKDTKNQAALKDKKDREKNLIGCFIVRDKTKISSKNVILLDDVTTTGSTLREAKKTLLAAGARHVWCIAIAH